MCKYRIAIIHGSYGSPNENWFPWLAEEAVRLGTDVLVPEFPTPEDQKLDTWLEAFHEHVGELDEKTVLIGHSIGAGFILRLLERSHKSIKGTFLVSGFIGSLGLEEFDSINASFVYRRFSWPRIRHNAGEVHVYNGDNDPYVPLEKGKQLARNLRCSLQIVHGGGHINTKSGFTKFPGLLNDLKALVEG